MDGTDALEPLFRNLDWLFETAEGLTLDREGRIAFRQALEASGASRFPVPQTPASCRSAMSARR